MNPRCKICDRAMATVDTRAGDDLVCRSTWEGHTGEALQDCLTKAVNWRDRAVKLEAEIQAERAASREVLQKALTYHAELHVARECLRELVKADVIPPFTEDFLKRCHHALGEE